MHLTQEQAFELIRVRLLNFRAKCIDKLAIPVCLIALIGGQEGEDTNSLIFTVKGVGKLKLAGYFEEAAAALRRQVEEEESLGG